MNIPSGEYICRVQQRAGIGRTHLEDDPGPVAFVDEEPAYRFGIRVSAEGAQQRIIEVPYDGPDRSRSEWHTPNSTLHAAYVGSNGELRAAEDLGFLNVGVLDERSRRVWFYHSAFEYAGGEDVVLSSRYGVCDPVG